jgi:hypothetical protein
MPAGLPGSSLSSNLANPGDGNAVIFDPLSGPKGSPFDGDTQTDIITGTVTPRGGCSTGALSTGIGITSEVLIRTPNLGPQSIPGVTAPNQIWRGGFEDNLTPGEVPTYSAGGPPPVVASSAINSAKMYIGGGRSDANVNGAAAPNPYTDGVAICGAGNGGARDGGAGPAYTGFPLKMVTATGTVANGAAIETGFNNRTGASMVTGQSTFGSATAVLNAPS